MITWLWYSWIIDRIFNGNTSVSPTFCAWVSYWKKNQKNPNVLEINCMTRGCRLWTSCSKETNSVHKSRPRPTRRRRGRTLFFRSRCDNAVAPPTWFKRSRLASCSSLTLPGRSGRQTPSTGARGWSRGRTSTAPCWRWATVSTLWVSQIFPHQKSFILVYNG